MTNNESMKISGGGSFRHTATAANVVTTGANEYAKVLISGHVQYIASASTLTVNVGGNSVRTLATQNSGDIKTISEGEGRLFTNMSSAEDRFVELLVPPSSNLSLTMTGGGTFLVTGTYTKFINT